MPDDILIRLVVSQVSLIDRAPLLDIQRSLRLDIQDPGHLHQDVQSCRHSRTADGVVDLMT